MKQKCCVCDKTFDKGFTPIGGHCVSCYSEKVVFWTMLKAVVNLSCSCMVQYMMEAVVVSQRSNRLCQIKHDMFWSHGPNEDEDEEVDGTCLMEIEALLWGFALAEYEKEFWNGGTSND